MAARLDRCYSKSMSEAYSGIPELAGVVDVRTYPVKSLPGVSRPDGVRITDNGLEYDRILTLAGTVVGENGVAPRLTLREHPELARIIVGSTDTGVTLAAEGMDMLVLPYEVDGGEPVAVKSWGGAVTGLHVSTAADEWLGSYLGRDDVQILAVPDSNRRVMEETERNSQATEFAGRATDGYPLHIVSLPSLRRLNEARAQSGLADISIDRFRANIILDGPDLPPFAEDKLSAMRFEDATGTVDIIAIRACVRCVSVEADPTTGGKLGNVLKSLGTLQPERTTPEKLVFGVWAAPSLVSVGGIIRAGQLLKPLTA